MKEQLVKAASDLGFVSPVIGKSVFSKISDKPFYYLWLCELQKWLREQFNMNVIPIKVNGTSTKHVCLVHWTTDIFHEKRIVGQCYNKVFEEGILEGLKLIKK
jgi:hypothetical protein